MAIDIGKLEEFLGRFTADLGATIAAGNVVIGHRLGLYQALAAGPAYASDMPKMAAAATAEQQALSRAGIKAVLRGYSFATFEDVSTTPAYVHQHDLGLAINGWGADWPDGFGFLYFLAVGPPIRPTGPLTPRNSTTRW